MLPLKLQTVEVSRTVTSIKVLMDLLATGVSVIPGQLRARGGLLLLFACPFVWDKVWVYLVLEILFRFCLELAGTQCVRVVVSELHMMRSKNG